MESDGTGVGGVNEASVGKTQDLAMTMDQCPSTVHEGPKHQPSKAELMERTRSLAGTVGGSPRGLVAYRSAEELADTPEFRDFVEREFPAGASELLSTSRRGFVSLMGASLALAGVAGMPGCRRPDHKIVPYGRNVPEHIIPGKALYFATSMGACVPLPLPGGPKRIRFNIRMATMFWK